MEFWKIKETFSSEEMFNIYLQFMNKTLRFVGVHINSRDFSYFNTVLILIFIDLITYLPINFYNIYMNRDDFIREMFCVVTIANGFEGAVKLYSFIGDRMKILRLTDMCVEFHSKVKSSQEHSEEFIKWMKISGMVFFALLVSFSTTGVLIFFYPLIYFIIFKKTTLHFGFVIPGIDPETVFGYMLNFAYHSMQLFIVLVSVYGTTCIVMLFMFSSFAQYGSLKISVKELDALIEFRGKYDKKVKKTIEKIVIEHNDLIEYLNCFNEIFSVYHFVDISCLIFQTTTTLFTLSANYFFIPGYPILVLDAFVILGPCILGTMLEIAAESFYDSITEISWFLLPVEQQKSILIILHSSIMERPLKWGLMKLDLQQFVDVSQI
jgi:odorant receptor